MSLLLAILTTITLALPTLAKAADAQGIVIVYDGSRPREYATAFEYVSFRSFGATYQVLLTNGKTASGLTNQILAKASYNYGSPAQLPVLEELAKNNVNAAALLKNRIARLKSAQSEPRDSTVSATSSAVQGNSIPSITENGITYRHVRPGGLHNGLLGFIHDNGVFSARVEGFTQRTLKHFAELNPKLNTNAEFKQLMDTFVPTLLVQDKVLKGVKILTISLDEVKLQSDSGVTTVPYSALPKVAWEKLHAAAKVDREMCAQIEQRKEADRQRMAAIGERRARENKEFEDTIAAVEAHGERKAAETKASSTASTVTNVIAGAVIAYGLYKFFSSFGGGDYGSSAAPAYGEDELAQQINRQNRRNEEAEDERERQQEEAMRRQDAARRAAEDDEYYRRRQQQLDDYERQRQQRGY
ncbi:MAG: hypothetical protein JNM99_01585 [Verrucomicrobiaceae bacterium]|nr:hypothetical protein [Verrucomicrobiaceae bacterium]